MKKTIVKRVPIIGNISGAGAYTYLGFTLAGSVLGLFFLGYWADGALGTRPWLAIAGAFIGATGGFINLVRTMNQLQEAGERREQEEAGRHENDRGGDASDSRDSGDDTGGKTGAG